MSHDVSVLGTVITVSASNTLPLATPIIAFSGSSDPFDVATNVIGDAEKGVNGDLITWSTANPLEVSINVISGSPADLILKSIGEANFPRSGGRNARDVITIAAIFPGLRKSVFTGGKMVEFQPGFSAGSDGKLKDAMYKFKFEDTVNIFNQ